MSDDSNPNRVGAVTGPEAKTPLERAKQIQELQRQQEVQPPAAPARVAQASVATSLRRVVQAFDAKQVAAVSDANPSRLMADQAHYAANQVEVGALFAPKGAEIEIIGVPWKIIPFGPPQIAPLLDLKKATTELEILAPPNAVKHKDGLLLQLTAKTPGGETFKKPVLVADRAALLPAAEHAKLSDTERFVLKGAEFKNKGALERALLQIPQLALNLFQSVFGEGVLKDTPQQHRLLSIEAGSKSAFEVKLERKNDLDGRWRTELVTLNNFGLKVPPSARDPRANDIIVAMYYLDRFQAG